MDDMEHKQGKTRSGLTLIEVMIAITVIVVGVLGAMIFRYRSALEARNADIQVGAGRVALLILEGWKGAAGKEVGVDTAYYSPAEDIPLSGEFDPIYITGTNPYTVELTGGIYTKYFPVILTRLDGATTDINGDGSNDPCLVKLTVAVTSGLHSVTLSDFVRIN